ncbi:MAG: deoxyribonuclease V [Deltaproteobacteria bacterium]|nr:MAG: deoxyribonuclease V [Deltaproteobacteria bacterium]
MNIPAPLHPWDLSIKEARQVQIDLARQVRLSFPPKTIRYIAGADVSFDRFSPVLHAGIVTLSFPELEVLEEAWVTRRATFPYVPGYLSFREAPAVLDVCRALKIQPDVMILDGQGIAHPRGLGLASHVGLFLNLPTIGCAKSLLVGEHTPVHEEKGATVPLAFHGKEVGRVVRTRSRVKPVYVSPGHLMELDLAAEIILRCCPRYRIPEPIRHAHRLVNRVRREYKENHAEV